MGLLWRPENPPLPPALESVDVTEQNLPERSMNRLDRHIGTAIHLALELLSAMPTLAARYPPALQQRIEHALRGLGVWGEALQQAMERVSADVERTLADDQGRWLLSPEHPENHSELALTTSLDGEVSDLVIDRTFVDAVTGKRWVIDYKSSSPPPGMPQEVFVREESARYLDQLRNYRDAVAQLGDEPVRCALYFTGLGLLHTLPELDT
jgi:ATP-dependent exoDNAse (exonuclease V) beta subunit